MPRKQPFTQLCQQAARLARPAADLHVHTTASDGDLTPSQLVALARAAGLSALAITDHDTTAGLEEAATAAAHATRPLRIIPGVEVTTEHDQREYHLLAYFIPTDDNRLAAALEHARSRRRARFRWIIDRLMAQRIVFPAGMVEAVEAASTSLGRRHIANLLVRVGVVGSTSEAFRRYLTVLPTFRDRCPGFESVLRLVADSGGVASLAHPPADVTRDDLATFQGLGLSAVEAHFPAATARRSRELCDWARGLGLRVTGGSDFHGNGLAGRGLGRPGLPEPDFVELCEFAGYPV